MGFFVYSLYVQPPLWCMGLRLFHISVQQGGWQFGVAILCGARGGTSKQLRDDLSSSDSRVRDDSYAYRA